MEREFKSGRGGRRDGAGRPAGREVVKAVSVRLTDEEAAAIKETGLTLRGVIQAGLASLDGLKK